MRVRKRALADLALLLAFAVICIGGLGYLARGMGMPVPFTEQGWILKARFSQAEGVVPQDDVYVAGVHVGRVLSIAPESTRGALVTMRIDPGVQLHTDVAAYVTPKTAVGDTYIDLVRTPDSTAPIATSGYVIPAARTGQAVQLDKILSTMSPSVRADLSQSLQDLGAAVSGQSTDIHTTIPQLGQVLANLQPIVQVTDARSRDLSQILTDLAVIMRSLAGEQDSLGTLVDSGDVAMSAIARRDSDLSGTVRQADTLMSSLDTILRGLTPADRASLEQAPPTLKAGQELLSQLNQVIDRVLPEILLAQVNYPNVQTGVVSAGGETVAQEWISVFSQRDSLGNAMRITPVVQPTNLVKLPIPLPGTSGTQSGGTQSGGTRGSPGSSPPRGASQPSAKPQARRAPSSGASASTIPSAAQILMELP